MANGLGGLVSVGCYPELAEDFAVRARFALPW